jgi:hypothetical protein
MLRTRVGRRTDPGAPGPQLSHRRRKPRLEGAEGSVPLSADLECACQEPRTPEPIAAFPPVAAPERLPLRRGGRADLIGDCEAPVLVAYLLACLAWRLLLIHVAKLVQF